MKKIIGNSWLGQVELTHTGNSLLDKVIEDKSGNVYTIVKTDTPEDLQDIVTFYELLRNDDSFADISQWNSGEWIVAGKHGQCERTSYNYLEAIADFIAVMGE